MSEVIDVQLDDEWTDLNTATGIAVGAAMNVQNKGEYMAFLQESTDMPTEDEEGFKTTTLGANYATPKVLAGSLKIWARCTSPGGTVLGVQEA